MSVAALAIELFTEELPPRALRQLGEAFAGRIANRLRHDGFVTPESTVTAYATPRRLAVVISAVTAQSPDRQLTQKLMPASVAIGTDGALTVAATRKLHALGRSELAERWPAPGSGPDRLVLAHDGKADALFLHSFVAGSPLQTGVQIALDEAIANLPIPKVMSYQRADGTTVRFVRPAHALLALHGPDLLPVTALGLDAGRRTHGHRFLGRGDITVLAAGAWDETLRAEGKVIASFAERRATIAAGLAAQAQGATVIMPDALLDEVTALVEWPVVYAGSFDRAFLQVPQECLILTMQQNQKYFAVADANGRLTHRFLLVSNLATHDPSAIIQGNERVLRARLADAKFFFDQDRRAPLESRLPKLESVVYHNRIGTQRERIERLRGLAGALAGMMGADRAAAERAALLAKADLVTDMVGEFPELQGLMGRYYAEHDGESTAVAAAIEQHYWPRHAGDTLPQGPIAQALALADKLETLAGMFGIGNEPAADKDPFGLRRAALGLLRIVIEGRLRLRLPDLVAAGFAAFSAVPNVQNVAGALEDFIYERLRGMLRELGYTANQVAAVIDGRPAELCEVPVRLAAVREFEALPEATALAVANKRIVNILKKSGGQASAGVDPARLADDAERELHVVFQQLEPVVLAHCASGDYTAALKALATAKPAVDRFFDEVMVMADDAAIRANRLALLDAVARTMNRVADLSRLAA
jgi:glycyl-tRNA synthetase beta chain